jgi:ADP-ribosylglycohydrolase
VAACYIYLEYLRKLLGGMEKRAAYAKLCGDFSDGHPRINADTLGKFARILRSDINALPEASIKSGGFVTDTLEVALWCFLTTDNYWDTVLKAVNLGDDSDTTVAVTGSRSRIAKVAPVAASLEAPKMSAAARVFSQKRASASPFSSLPGSFPRVRKAWGVVRRVTVT